MKPNLFSSVAIKKFTYFFYFLIVFTSINSIAQTSYTFTSCSATGQYGPNQTQVNAAYASTNLSGAVTSSSGIQYWTVPAGLSLVKIEVYGAQGGSSGGALGGLGAKIQGEFNVTPGQVLKILVGQQGLGSTNGAAGGGGGSYVATSSNVPLIVAGGGSGAGDISYPGLGAGTSSLGSSGQNCITTSTTGFGGADATSCNCGNGGAGGFYGNGMSASCYGSQFGYGFINGGNGGTSASGLRHGGFGGGCGTHSNNTGGGAGGGYTGGSASYHGSQYVGGAGSAYNSGNNQVNTPSVQAGNGKVIITQLCNGAPAPIDITPPSNQTICANNSTTLSVSGSGVNWYNSPTSTVVLGSGNTFVTSSLAAGNYSFYAAATNTCSEGARTTITVSVVGTLPINVSGASSFVCSGSPLVLAASGADIYNWSTGATGSTLIVTPTTNTFYTVMGTSTVSGCTGFSIKTVSVFPSTPLTTAGGGTICNGQSTSLGASGATSYTWQPGLLTGFFVSVSPTITTNYTVTGLDNYGCYTSSVVNVFVYNCVTGITTNIASNATILVYPNPTSGQIVLQSTSSEVKWVEIYDITGRIILKELITLKEATLNISDYSNGVYYLRVITQHDNKVIRIIKE